MGGERDSKNINTSKGVEGDIPGLVNDIHIDLFKKI